MTNRDELLAQMNVARTELESVIATLRGREDIDLGDGWRVRDVLAHIALWERVSAWWLTGADVPHAEGLVGMEPWDLNAFNEGMRERWRLRPLSEVYEEFAAAHEALVALVSDSSEEDCATGGRVWVRNDECGTGHYREHMAALETAR
ncbi:MAG TPA: ClbS/DfsB family four-helix bundle protein [Nitrolancea sp.]|nr:ClbS/DfsB family four-helix bundle protein [Nitrolancea sp.]